MKKLLAMLLIATMLVASVTCALAVSAEEAGTTTETAPKFEVMTDILSKIQDKETEDFKVEKVEGGVKVTFKKTVAMYSTGTEPNPLGKVCDFTDVSANFKETAYIQVAFSADSTLKNAEGSSPAANGINLRYTRKDKAEGKLADLLFESMTGEENTRYASADGKEVVWDVGNYIASHKDASNNPDRIFDDGIHRINELAIYGVEGASFTITKLAFVKPATTPDEGDGKDDPNPDEGDGKDDPNPDEGDGKDDPNPDEGKGDDKTPGSDSAGSATTPADSGSTAPGTGDTGMIVFAVLAVLAVVGGVAAVRVRR